MDDLNNVVFDDDELDDIYEPSNDADKDNEQKDVDLTTEVLRLKGIKDPQKIKFEDDNGNLIEKSWDSLSKDEQLNILVGEEPSDPKEDKNDYNEDEIQLINSIRESGMTVEDYLNSIAPTEVPKEYNVDSLSDEDIYALDLLNKVGEDNITDEEITQAVEAAKQNQDLFKKTVEGLRKEYIRLQEQEEADIERQQKEKREKEYQDFSNTIQDQIHSLNSFAGQSLELSNDDIEDLSSFILDLDDQGISAFGKAMNDPALFTKAAFWLLNEDKITEELNNQIQESYNKGYEDAKKEFSKDSTKLVFQPIQKNADNDFFDDDDW